MGWRIKGIAWEKWLRGLSGYGWQELHTFLRLNGGTLRHKQTRWLFNEFPLELRLWSQLAAFLLKMQITEVAEGSGSGSLVCTVIAVIGPSIMSYNCHYRAYHALEILNDRVRVLCGPHPQATQDLIHNSGAEVDDRIVLAVRTKGFDTALLRQDGHAVN